MRALAAEAERLLDDESPLVRGAAVWALSQLMEREEFAALAAKAIGAESDETVRAEWQRAELAVMPRTASASEAPMMITALDFSAQNSVMVPRHDKSAVLHQRPRRLHSDPGRERPVGPEIAARPRHHRAVGVRDRAAPWRRRFRAGAADGRHVPPAELRADRGQDAGRSATACASRWSKPSFFSGGVSMARASCQLLRKTRKPARHWSGRRRTGTCRRLPTFPRRPIRGLA